MKFPIYLQQNSGKRLRKEPASVFFAIVSLLSFVVPCSFAGDAEAGKKKAAVCIACHGVDGVGTAEIYPNLAGQKEGYLVSSIKAYRDGDRTAGMSAVMVPMVKALSDEDVANLAAYYSGLDAK